MIAGHPHDLAAAGQRPGPLRAAGGVEQRPHGERRAGWPRTIASTSATTPAPTGPRARFYRPVGPLRSRPMPRLSQLSRSIDGQGRRRHRRRQRHGSGHRAPARRRGRARWRSSTAPPTARQAVADEIAGNGGRAVAIDVDLADAAATDDGDGRRPRRARARSTSSSTTPASASPAPIDQDGVRRRVGHHAGRSTSPPTRARSGPASTTCSATAPVASSTWRPPRGSAPRPASSPYTASKHGVVGLTRSLAVELGPDRRHRQLHLPRPDPHRA